MWCATVQHSKTWWLGATLSTAIPVIYSFSGGMRASIMTDATQVPHLLACSSGVPLFSLPARRGLHELRAGQHDCGLAAYLECISADCLRQGVFNGVFLRNML